MAQQEPESGPGHSGYQPPGVPAWAQSVVARISQLDMDLTRNLLENPRELDSFVAELGHIRHDTDIILSRYNPPPAVRWRYRLRAQLTHVERRLRALELNLLYVLPPAEVIARVPSMRAELKRHIRTDDPRYDLFSRTLDAVAANAGTTSVARPTGHFVL